MTESHPERKNPRKISKKALATLGAATAATVFVVSPAGRVAGDAMDRWSQSMEHVQPEQKKQFNETIEPVAKDAAAQALEFYEAHKDNFTDPDLHVYLSDNRKDPDIAELTILQSVSDTDFTRQIEVFAGKTNGKLDVNKLKAVNITLADSHTFQTTYIESGEGKYGAVPEAGFWQISEATMYRNHDDPDRPGEKMTTVLMTGNYSNYTDISQKLVLAERLANEVPEKINKALRPFQK